MKIFLSYWSYFSSSICWYHLFLWLCFLCTYPSLLFVLFFSFTISLVAFGKSPVPSISALLALILDNDISCEWELMVNSYPWFRGILARVGWWAQKDMWRTSQCLFGSVLMMLWNKLELYVDRQTETCVVEFFSILLNPLSGCSWLYSWYSKHCGELKLGILQWHCYEYLQSIVDNFFDCCILFNGNLQFLAIMTTLLFYAWHIREQWAFGSPPSNLANPDPQNTCSSRRLHLHVTISSLCL